MSDTKKITLNNGVEMPVIGFGTFQINDPQACENSVLAAIETGYRLIDTAKAYGNEEAVGKAVKKSGIAREEIFVTTKLWIRDMGYESAKKAFDLSLKKLGLDYLDLYLIHWPQHDVFGAWKAMEELYKEGRIKAIGVCNFQPDRLMDLMLYNEIIPAVNQIETHPLYQRKTDHEFLVKNEVCQQAWAPFGQGKINIFENETLLSLAAKHGKKVSQVVLRWLIQRNIAVIPKSVQAERIAENFQVFDFELQQEDMDMMSALDTASSALFNQRDPEQIKRLSTF